MAASLRDWCGKGASRRDNVTLRSKWYHNAHGIAGCSYALFDINARLGERAQRFRLEDNGPALLHSQNAAPLPIAQTAVDVFPCRAGHFGQFALREGKLRGTTALSRIMQKSFGEPRRQIEEGDVGHALVGAANSRAKDFHELQAGLGTALQKWQDIASLQNQQLAFGERGRIRRARPAVKKRDLPEQFAGPQIGEDDLSALGRGQGDA